MNKILLALFLISSTTFAKDNILEGYNDFIVNEKILTSNERSIKYARKVKQTYGTNQYGLRFGETSLFYKTDLVQKNTFVEYNEVYARKSNYWENYIAISPDHTFLPKLKIELNNNISNGKMEHGIGGSYRLYNNLSIFTINIQNTWYLDRGDYFNIKVSLPIYKGVQPSYSAYYNLVLSKYLEVRPYYSGGVSIEDVNLLDDYNLYGILVKINATKDISISPFYEHYMGKQYRDTQKAGIKLNIEF